MASAFVRSTPSLFYPMRLSENNREILHLPWLGLCLSGGKYNSLWTNACKRKENIPDEIYSMDNCRVGKVRKL